jgi:glycosyltransferase involved in cell wall biosynthesis
MYQPWVSVIICNYNYGAHLGKAIDSAINQSYHNTEVVVVDDGSTDNSRDIIESYSNRIVSVFKDNGGLASAFNQGFLSSSGEIICFLDADDTFEAHRVARTVYSFKPSKDVGWCLIKQISGSRSEKTEFKSSDYLTSLINRRKKIAEQDEKPFAETTVSALSFRRKTLNKIFPMPVSKIGLNDNLIEFAAAALSSGF